MIEIPRVEDKHAGALEEEPLPQLDPAERADLDHEPEGTGEDKPERNIYEFMIRDEELIIPKSLADVERSRLKDYWLQAMDREFSAFIYFELFELVPRDSKMKPLRGHWVFDRKLDKEGIVIQLKARWVVDGSKLTGLFSLYAPVVEFAGLRALIIWAVEHGYEIHVVDASNAFLNSGMNPEDGPIFMQQVFGYVDPLRPDHVCQLRKSLYGLPQSAANWNSTMSERIKLIGFKQAQIDRCIFYESETGSYIAGHVDDLVLLGRAGLEIETMKNCIKSKFPIKDRGEIETFLGMEFQYFREEREIYIRQREKIEKAYDLIRAKPAASKIPIQPNVNLFQNSEEYGDPFHYRSVVGLLNYIAHMTRPDMQFCASQFSRFMKSPTVYQYNELCKAISYLHASRDLCLSVVFDSKSEPDGCIHTFVDCGEPNLIENLGRRTTGMVVTYRSNLIGWSTKRQTAITSDVVEGELFALNSGLRKSLGIRNLLEELGLIETEQQQKIHMYTDSKTAGMIADEGFKQNSKHYDRSLLFVQEYLRLKQVDVHKVAGKRNPADLLTKFVTSTQHKEVLPFLGFRLPGRQRKPVRTPVGENEDTDETTE